MTDETRAIALVALGTPAFVLVFVAFWSGVSFLIATLSGYRALLPYRADDAGDGDAFLTPARLRFGWSSYKGGLVSFTARADGLGIEVSSWFPGHPKVRVPWARVVREGPAGFGGGVRFVLADRTTLVLGDEDAATFSRKQAAFLAQPRP